MKALGITVLIFVLIIIVVAGSMQLKKRGKEKDKSVAEATEVETSAPIITKASGIKPVNITKVLSNLKEKTKAINSISPIV